MHRALYPRHDRGGQCFGKLRAAELVGWSGYAYGAGESGGSLFPT